MLSQMKDKMKPKKKSHSKNLYNTKWNLVVYRLVRDPGLRLVIEHKPHIKTCLHRAAKRLGIKLRTFTVGKIIHVMSTQSQ